MLIVKIKDVIINNWVFILIPSFLLGYAFHSFRTSKNHLYGFLLLISGFITLFYLRGLIDWISSLGGDSYFEAIYYNNSEGIFWLQNFISASSQMRLPLNKTSILIITLSLLFSVIFFVLISWRSSLLRLFFAIFLGSLSIAIYGVLDKFEEIKNNAYQLVAQFDESPGGFTTNEDIDLFVYIGESTSSLNLGIYGYPLDTTPNLAKLVNEDNGLMIFQNVRSKNTHTSPSLLNALSISHLSPDNNSKLIGIGSILKSAGVNGSLFSVQPISGSFSQFSHLVFNGIISGEETKDMFKGNYAHPKNKDHEVLNRALHAPGVVFFHSYGGHGDYLDFIDTNLSHAVTRPIIDFNGVFGDRLSNLLDFDLVKQIEDYDRAITYIDRNVATAINDIKLRTKPAALIYFSDHGEAVYSKGAHDSARYIDEMSRVPALVYFNEAYRRKYPGIYSSYLKATKSRKFKLLDQIAPTILDVLRINSVAPIEVPALNSTSKHPRPYILERTTLSGISGINLEYDRSFGVSGSKVFGGIFEPTAISVINEMLGESNPICYHRSNSFAKAVRGAAATNCLEFDLVVDGNDLNVFHPPKVATGFNIQHIFEIAEPRRSMLWIDAKNLSESAACHKLVNYLEINRGRVGRILVEFPSEAISKLEDLRTCTQRMERIGVERSYYIPTDLLLSCSNNKDLKSVACIKLDGDLQKVIDAGVFSDLSFDFGGYSAIKLIKRAHELNWNTWAIQAVDFHHFPLEKFNFVILDTMSDPNGY